MANQNKELIEKSTKLFEQVIEDEQNVRKQYHDETFKEVVALSLEREGYPKSYAANPNVYTLEYSETPSDIAENFADYYTVYYDIEDALENISLDDAYHYLFDITNGQYFVISLNVDDLKSGEFIEEAVELYKEQYEVDVDELETGDLEHLVLEYGYENYEYEDAILEAKHQAIEASNFEVSAEDAATIISQYNSAFITEVKKPSNLSGIRKVALDLIDEYQIFNDEQAQSLLYDNNALFHESFYSGYLWVGIEPNDSCFSLLYEADEDEIKEIIEEIQE
ncbi:hypothetical protein ACR56S_03785 [Staphylococcus hominis]|uniref:hypothetical protein n=1 Tax=Staphylococcus hominis TaxID=1290 RepID=UPI003DA09610